MKIEETKEEYYQPYVNAKEFLQAQKEHGILIKETNNSRVYHIGVSLIPDTQSICFICDDKTNYGIILNPYTLYRNFVFDKDNTPCGRKIFK